MPVSGLSSLPPPEAERPELSVPYKAPRDEMERKICQMMEAQLSVRPVGTEDNCFDLGGNSLSALTREVQDAFGRSFPLIVFFTTPTVAALARFVREKAPLVPSGEASAALVPVQKAGSDPPFFCVHGAGGVAYGHGALRLLYRKVRSFIEIWGGFAPHAMDEMFVRLASQRAERARLGQEISGIAGWMERRMLAFAKRNSVLGQLLDEDSPLLTTPACHGDRSCSRWRTT
ncbi:phosphopantetheine-binding protein [Sorangium sp. So ce362]|uniref:phosphopantetheine-binding protein n=1 Tax=Sorangium sp. So ce362 TaxID=3133303 RepID=UPI003F5E544F